MLSHESKSLLTENYENPKNPSEVRETCFLALERLKWVENEKKKVTVAFDNSSFLCVDPAPPFLNSNGLLQGTTFEEVKYHCKNLFNQSNDIFTRYRSLFTIRDKLCSGDLNKMKAAVDLIVNTLSKALHCPSSDLYRHEIAYVLGQILSIKDSVSLSEDNLNRLIIALKLSIEKSSEHGMVRHESAMALGEIENVHSKACLKKYSTIENCAILSDSCIVALNMVEDVDKWVAERF